MAVLAEGLSVVIRRSAVDARFPGGLDAFVAQMQNETFCHDDRLARLGFSSPPEVEAFINRIEANGLTYLDGDPMKRVAGCQGVNGANPRLITPEGWTFDGSVSQKFPIQTTRH